MSNSMRQEQRLIISQKQKLKLIASQQLRLYLKLLQKNNLELQEYIEQEMKENPVLEEATPEPQPKDSEIERPSTGALDMQPGSPALINQFDSQHFMEYYSRMHADDGDGIRYAPDEPPLVETIVSGSESLVDHLMWQFRLSDYSEKELEIGEYIIGNLNEYGYLVDTTPQDIADELDTDVQTVENVRHRIMELDPVGCGAINVRESLIAQIDTFMPGNKKLLTLVENHLVHLEKGKYETIRKKMRISMDELVELVGLLRQLEPRPGQVVSSEAPEYVTPDVFVYKEGDDYRVVVNDDGLPKLRISSYYERVLNSNTATAKEKEYVRQRIHRAMDLIRSIRQRQQTLKQIMESIVRFQRKFFDKGLGYLEPLKQRDVAEDIGVHESTVSRATTNRYVHTPRGMFPLKFFFNNGVERTSGPDLSSVAVQAMVKTLIEKEDPDEPLTDDNIRDILKSQGIIVARRTIAKYRTKFGIPSSTERKKRNKLI